MSESVRNRNPELYGTAMPVEFKDTKKRKVGISQVSSSVSTSTLDKLNKTERRYYEFLKRTRQNERIGIQDITLRLANGVRYTADFSTWSEGDSRLTLHEVKGFMRDDAWVKLKVAAHEFPMYDFILVTKGQAGAWETMEVKQ